MNLIRNKNEYIFNIIMNEYFEINSDDEYIHFSNSKIGYKRFGKCGGEESLIK